MYSNFMGNSGTLAPPANLLSPAHCGEQLCTKKRQQLDHNLNKTVLLHFLGTERTPVFCTNQ